MGTKYTEIRVPIFEKKSPKHGVYFVTAPIFKDLTISLKDWLVFVYPVNDGEGKVGDLVFKQRTRSKGEDTENILGTIKTLAENKNISDGDMGALLRKLLNEN